MYLEKLGWVFRIRILVEFSESVELPVIESVCLAGILSDGFGSLKNGLLGQLSRLHQIFVEIPDPGGLASTPYDLDDVALSGVAYVSVTMVLVALLISSLLFR